MSSRRLDWDRYCLGAVTALIVARTLTPGDDPGRLRLTTSGGPLSFNLCVFLVLTFVAFRTIVARRVGQPGALIVPLLLAAIGGLAYAGPGLPDSYRLPGTFWAWEWLTLGAAFLLVRMVCLKPADGRGLANAVVATAVSVAILATYQGIARKTGIATGDPIIPTTTAMLAGEPEYDRHLFEQLSKGPHPHGTFGSAEALVAFLLLALPMASITWRHHQGQPGHRRRFLVPLLIMIALITGLLAISFAHKPDEWRMANRIITEHWQRGVGPGNYARFATGPFVPGGFWPGLVATLGIAGVGLLVLAIAIALKSALTGPPPTDDAVETGDGPRWELYLGGMAGLCLGFIWMAGAVPPEAPPTEYVRLGGIALIRAIVWFAALSAMESCRLPNRLVIRATLLGVGLVAIFGMVSDAVAQPAVLLPAMAMLALAGCVRRPTPMETTPRLAFTNIEVALASLTAAICFIILAASPGWSTTRAVRDARLASRLYPDLVHKVDVATTGGAKATARTNARVFLNQNILTPLVEAVNRDPKNAALRVEVARWRRQLWDLQLALDPKAAGKVADDTLASLKVAQQLDPRNLAAWRMEFDALMQFRRGSERNTTLRMNDLIRVMDEVIVRDPTVEVAMRYRLVGLLLDDRELVMAGGRRRAGLVRLIQAELDRQYSMLIESEVTQLLKKNRAAGNVYGQISEVQRANIVERAIKVIPNPSAELLEEWTQQ